jgi:flagellar biosynthesis protein FlhF
VDLLLIDTAGASPSAPEEMERLADLVREAGPSEVHLVLGAATGLPQMLDALRAYRQVGVDRLLLTKLDETDRLGAACSLAALADLPVSYTTDGRDVPGNLHAGDPEQLCRALFSRRPHVAG